MTVKNEKFMKLTALFLVATVVLGTIFSLPVSAASGDKVTITFDYCYDSTGNTIKYQQKTVNGEYTVGVKGEELCKIYADGKEAYCIEPGHTLYSGNTLTENASTVWENLGTAKQKAINLALLYGKPGSDKNLSGNEDQKWIAMQLIVWEFVTGCRNTADNYKCTNTKYIDGICADGANSGVKSVYNTISKKLEKHSTVPSFASAAESKTETYEMKYSDGKYSLTLNDSNSILSEFSFKSQNGITVSQTDNKLTLTSSKALNDAVTFTSAKAIPNVEKAVFVPYGDASLQDVITGVENDGEPVKAYFKVKTQTGNLKLIKTSEDGKIADIEFTVKGDNYNKTVKTNLKGEFELADLVPGTYTVTEKSYKEYIAQKTQTVKVENGKTAVVKFDNILKKSEIKIIKKDAETKQVITLAGFGFKIKKSDGSFINTDKTDVFYTDDTGTINLPVQLAYGKYQLVEVKAGEGYVLDSKPVDFEVDGENTVVEVVKYDKVQKGTVTVIKTGDIFASIKKVTDTATLDEMNKEAEEKYLPVYENSVLNGVEFKITAAEDIKTPDGTVRIKKGEVADTITTEKGNAISKPLYLGKYFVTETKTVSGFVLNKKSYTVHLKYDGENVEVTNQNLSVRNDRQKAEISLKKVLEKSDETGGDIKKVFFALYANENIKADDGNYIPKDGLIEIAGCLENGSLTFNTDIPFGKYYVKEYKTDEKYVLDDTKYEFEFLYTDENTAVQKIEINSGKEIVNKPITGYLEITKKDVSTEKLLPNAGFRIKDENGNIVAKKYTDEKGIAKFAINYGKYTYEEFDAPDGYVIDTKPYPFEIKKNGEVIKAEMTNEKQPEPEKPQTGDNSNIGFFIGLGAVALGGLIAFVFIKFKKKDEDDD